MVNTLHTSEKGTMVLGRSVYIDGKKIPDPPCDMNNVNITTIDKKVYINGYEYKNGKWKRTLVALWHYLF